MDRLGDLGRLVPPELGGEFFDRLHAALSRPGPLGLLACDSLRSDVVRADQGAGDGSVHPGRRRTASGGTAIDAPQGWKLIASFAATRDQPA